MTSPSKAVSRSSHRTRESCVRIYFFIKNGLATSSCHTSAPKPRTAVIAAPHVTAGWQTITRPSAYGRRSWCAGGAALKTSSTPCLLLPGEFDVGGDTPRGIAEGVLINTCSASLARLDAPSGRSSRPCPTPCALGCWSRGWLIGVSIAYPSVARLAPGRGVGGTVLRAASSRWRS